MGQPVTKELCDVRHKEVESLKADLINLRNRVDNVKDGLESKLNRIYVAVLTVLFTLIAQLVIKLVSM